MPFYEYQCTSCGHEEELLQKISDKPLKKCPECGKSTMKKVISAAAFRLKGSGWYETDFKSGKKKMWLEMPGPRKRMLKRSRLRTQKRLRAPPGVKK